MSGGRLTIWIDGREALPVRAIPYVTGWNKFSPDVVARYMAQARNDGLFTEWDIPLTAYQLHAGAPTAIASRDWDAVVVTLNGYEAELEQHCPNDAINRAAWLNGAVNMLPGGVFVWLDEFERAHQSFSDRVTFIDERPDDNRLTPTPMLDAKIQAMVLEGFERHDESEHSAAGDAPKVDAGVTAAIEEPETKNWKLRIQAEAARRWKVLRDAGANPTKHNIKDDLAKWCRETNVLTDGDINPNAEYIYRHVLGKWMPPTG